VVKGDLEAAKFVLFQKDAFVQELMMHQLHHAIQWMGWHGKA